MSEVPLYIASFSVPIKGILLMIKSHHVGATPVAIQGTGSHMLKLAKHASCLKDI